MRNIPTWKLNNHDPAFEVQKNKMGRMIDTIIMSNHLIDLVGSRKPIGRVQLMLTPPVAKHLKSDKDSKHGNHTDADIYQPVLTPLRRGFGMKHNSSIALLNRIWLSYRIAYGAPRHTCRILIVARVFLTGWGVLL